MLLFLKLFAVIVTALAGSYVLGVAALRILQVSLVAGFLRLFGELVMGVTILIVGYAIWKTHGVTILLPLPLLFAVALKIQHRNPNAKQDIQQSFSSLYAWIVVLLIGGVLFTARYFLLYDTNSPFLRTPFQDYVYYSRLSMPLTLLGLETNTLEAVYPQFIAEQPYHYFELWLNALLVDLTGLPSAWCLYLGTYTVLITVVACGFMAILAHFQVKRQWIPALGILLLTITGIGWPFLKNWSFFQNGGLIASSILLLQPKLAPVYFTLLLAVLQLLRKQYVAAGIMAAAAPIMFVSTTPVIGLGFASLTAFLVYTRRVKLIVGLWMLVPITLVCVFIAGFYLLQPEPFKFPGTGRAFVFSTIIPAPNETRLILNIAVGALLNFALYFGAYILLILLLLFRHRRPLASVWHNHQEILLLFGICLFFAAFFRAFGTHYVDSFQFFSNTMIPLTAVLLAVGIAIGLSQAGQATYVFTAVTLVALIIINGYDVVIDANKTLVTTRYSPDFLRSVQAIMPQLGARGGFLLADEDYQNAFMLSPDSYTSGTYISNFKNNYAFTTLSAFVADSLTSDPRFLNDSVQAQQAQQRSTLYRFSNFRKLQGRPLSPDSAVYQFVREVGISFVCASRKAVLPATLQPLVKAQYTDSLSGERLYVLRTKFRAENQKDNPYMRP